jgi:glycosyltransferase involved in cell wall biosynthesis
MSPDSHPFSPVVVAPTFNNAATLADLVARVRATGLPLIVVNDGSTDATRSILDPLAASHGVQIQTHPINRGKAAALATGFAAASAMGYTHAATIDTDGQLFPEALPALADLARSRPRALVLGVRKWRIPRCPSKSLIGRGFSNAAIWCECGVKVTDTQCGLRVYPLALVAAAACRAGRFAFETEVIARAAWGGWPIVQVPVDCLYLPPGRRVSHFRPWRDSVAALGMHARLAMAALAVRRGKGWRPRSRGGERGAAEAY